MGRAYKTLRIEYSTPKKARFRALVEDAGWSGCKAAAYLGLPQSTASCWLKQPVERRTGKTRPGRPRILSQEKLDKIETWFSGFYKYCIMLLQDIIKQFKLECLPSTLLCTLNKRGFHSYVPELKDWLLSKNNEEQLQFATAIVKKPRSFWRKGIFTDVSTFNT